MMNLKKKAGQLQFCPSARVLSVLWSLFFVIACLVPLKTNPFDQDRSSEVTRVFNLEQKFFAISLLAEHGGNTSGKVENKGPLIGELTAIGAEIARAHPLYEISRSLIKKVIQTRSINYIRSGLSPPQTPVV